MRNRMLARFDASGLLPTFSTRSPSRLASPRCFRACGGGSLRPDLAARPARDSRDGITGRSAGSGARQFSPAGCHAPHGPHFPQSGPATSWLWTGGPERRPHGTGLRASGLSHVGAASAHHGSSAGCDTDATGPRGSRPDPHAPLRGRLSPPPDARSCLATAKPLTRCNRRMAIQPPERVDRA